jgi:cytochrome b6-f complex iron-sulfur subunit
MAETNHTEKSNFKIQKFLTGRRDFLQKVGWVGVLGMVAGTIYTALRFFSPKVLYEPAGVFMAGYPEDYAVGTVSDIWKDKQKVWLVRTETGLYSLISICTHLGCTPSWFETDQQFKCPCHGSVFTKEGDVVSGPAPEPLYRAPIKLAANGKILTGNGLLGIRLAGQANQDPLRSSEAFFLEL